MSAERSIIGTFLFMRAILARARLHKALRGLFEHVVEDKTFDSMGVYKDDM